LRRFPAEWFTRFRHDPTISADSLQVGLFGCGTNVPFSIFKSKSQKMENKRTKSRFNGHSAIHDLTGSEACLNIFEQPIQGGSRVKLQEKQMWAEVQPQISDVQVKISEAVGAPVKIVVHEESFSSKDLIARIPDAALAFLLQGFEDFCADGMAKEAAKGAVKSIGLKQDTTENFKLAIQGETLEVIANFADGGTCGIQYPHQNDYAKFLGENL
jgi:hypothetical protein